MRGEAQRPVRGMRVGDRRGLARPGLRGRDEGEAGERRVRRRMFDGGELRLVLMLLMEAEPRHGYDLMREIETRTGGAYAPSPGIVYPTLALLEDLGQVEARAAAGAKKRYAMTPDGLARLAEKRGQAEAALARLDALGRKDAPLEAGPVPRAMANLKAALRQRLSGDHGLSGDHDKQVLFLIADAIDEAARKIERL
jgi:DNA-binding PadR family transcriptional regulator